MPRPRKRRAVATMGTTGAADLIKHTDHCQIPSLHVFDKLPASDDFLYRKCEVVPCKTPLPSSKELEQFTFEIRSLPDEVIPFNRIFLDFTVTVWRRRGGLDEKLKVTFPASATKEEKEDKDSLAFITGFGQTFFNNYNLITNNKQMSLPNPHVSYDTYITLLTEWETLEWDMYKDLMKVYWESHREMIREPLEWNVNKRIEDSDIKYRFYCPIMFDMFRSPKYLIPNLNITLNLYRARDEFCLMSTTATPPPAAAPQPVPTPTKTYFVKVESACLHVHKLKLSPYTLRSLETALNNKPAIYNYIKKDIKVYTIPVGVTRYEVDIYNGTMPNHLALFQLRPEAIRGD